jgi:two-component system response regulator
VVVLTTSSAQEDIARAYELHANCYITKPVNMGDFARLVSAIEVFWFNLVELPAPS